MKPPLRIAILECDTPLDQTREKYGGYGGVFKALLHAGANALGDERVSAEGGLDISTWDVVNKQDYPDHDEIDAILITGSRFNSFDNDEWILKLVSYTEQLLKQDRVRIIGVCYGHQIVGRAMGAPVGRSDKGWEASVTLMKLSEKGQALYRKEILSIHQMHRDVVKSYPPGVEELGSSPRCDVQGMYAKNRLMTVQGHPEFNEQIMRELLESRHFQGIFDDKLYDDAMSRVANHHDGVIVGAAFLRFLLDD
ncbi:MAG: hypothetical protein M1828_002408 [Chrysothrix sp. TS-e1954]|nr:MAG: hypothetical protein M1828_002408 [Chrysothrix sp. TS-e1954]